MKKGTTIIFDLGGVLIQLGDSPFPDHWLSPNQSFALSDWFKSEVAQQFERGLISANQFSKAIKEDLELSASEEEICMEFSNWPIGPYEGAFELLRALKEKFALAVLTNTNELHWPRIVGEFAIPQYCEHIFASHLIGLVKPDLSAYEHVVTSLNAPAESIVFFDDNSANVESALSMGIQAHLVRGIEELSNKVLELGLLSANKIN